METSQVYWRGLDHAPLELEDIKSLSMGAFLQIFEVPLQG